MWRICLVLSGLLCLVACQPQQPVTKPVAKLSNTAPNLAEQFVAAYNQHNVQGMLALVHSELKYMFISGDQLHTETHDKAALEAFLGRYFVNTPAAHSQVLSSAQQGPFIQQLERAIWTDAQGQPKAQCSQSIYQVKDQLIVHIWYFDAFSCP
ncbi:nuclear transport factor 2 family protein [Marinicella meishanensis]|uniref:nuclear transport factor 2 family protein n=1 Tax=Marinicella meishanensis TaxID=2873263 RepID=UPI001CBDDA65|nr:nuclear transport factor 2 family protein [Marinicella sp. NBU2979]